MTSIVINGNAYSDDGSTPQDMQHYGYLTHLLPMIGDTATVAGQVATDAAQAALDAATASNGALALRGTSTTSLAVSAGTKTLTTQTGKQFTAGNYVTISRTSAPTTLMHGVVTSYSGATLIVEAATIAGSGTFTDWTIALSGAKGDTGPTGNGQMAYLAKTGTYTVTAADKGKLIDCTSGTFTLSFQACATLGADWTTYIRNSGTGLITLDPNGAETINGAATYPLNAGSTAMLSCDGSVIRCAFVVLNELVRLPIFSAETLTATPASVLEDIFDSYPDTLISGKYVSSIHFGSGLFVASASTSSANVSTSPDGLTWTLRAMPSTLAWQIGTDGTSFVATVGSSTSIARSTNGTTWTAGTALPGVASNTKPLMMGGVTLAIAGAASTFYRSTDYGNSAWTTQTTPTAIGTHVSAVGGLFWYHASGTSAYTSASGLTGSWTSRTLPVTPITSWVDQDQALCILGTGTNVFRSTDGINWTDIGASLGGGAFFRINGVDLIPSNTFGETKTRSNGITTVRYSGINPIINVGYGSIAKSGSVLVINSSIANGMVGRIDASAPVATALFTR
jgi:hypothetical protein